MLNGLWGCMILIGIGFGVATGQIEALSNATIDSAGEAVTLAITMLGVMSMWTGLMEVARQAGVIAKLTNSMKPILRFLFPRIPSNHVANEYIATNMIANMLALGWAATPMGLKAALEMARLERQRRAALDMGIGEEELKRLFEEEEDEYSRRKLEEIRKKADALRVTKASDELCTFLVINISSLQLIPVSIIAYRSRYGAVNPMGIVVPGILATTVSTLAGVIFCKIACRKKQPHNG